MSSSSCPFVSVLMPLRNEAAFIERSLGAVLAQGYPHEQMEVLIADGMSTDNTREIVLSRRVRSDVPITIVDNVGQIAPTGLNAALGLARGDIIVRVDGHTVVASDYVAQCIEALRRSGADNVGGRMEAINDGTFGRAVALATSSPFGVGGARFHYSQREQYVDTVYLGAWPKAVFDRIGLFDEELVRNQDDEFNYRLCEQGGKILLSPKIRSQYYSRSTVRSLWRQYLQYGFWKVRVMQKHPHQMRARHFAPPAFVASLLGFGLLAPVSRVSLRLCVATVITYLVSSLSASVVIARSHGWKYLPVLPIVFGTLHLSYGLGFLSGLVKFWNRWDHKETRAPKLVQPTQGQEALTSAHK